MLGGFLGAQLAAGAGALVVNIFSARALGPDGRGQIALFLQIGVTLGVLLLGGVERSYPAIIVGRPALPGAVRDLRRLAWPGVLTVAAACAAASVVLFANGRPEAFPAAMTALVAAGSGVGSAVRSASSSAGVSRPFVIATVAGQVSLVIAGVVMLAADVTSPGVWLLAYGLSLLVPFLSVARRGRPTGADLRQVRSVGWRVLPSTLAGMVMLRSDRLLLPALAGYGQLGVYGVVATFTEMISLPVAAYVDSHIPAWSQGARAGTLGRRRILAATLGYAVLAVGVTTVGIRLLLVPVFGPDYAPGIALAVPLAAAAALYGISRVGVGLAMAAGRTRVVGVVDVTAMIVSVTLYLLLIPHLGAMGAALGSLGGYGIAAVLSVYAVWARSK